LGNEGTKRREARGERREVRGERREARRGRRRFSDNPIKPIASAERPGGWGMGRAERGKGKEEDDR